MKAFLVDLSPNVFLINHQLDLNSLPHYQILPWLFWDTEGSQDCAHFSKQKLSFIARPSFVFSFSFSVRLTRGRPTTWTHGRGRITFISHDPHFSASLLPCPSFWHYFFLPSPILHLLICNCPCIRSGAILGTSGGNPVCCLNSSPPLFLEMSECATSLLTEGICPKLGIFCINQIKLRTSGLLRLLIGHFVCALTTLCQNWKRYTLLV